MDLLTFQEHKHWSSKAVQTESEASGKACSHSQIKAYCSVLDPAWSFPLIIKQVVFLGSDISLPGGWFQLN